MQKTYNLTEEDIENINIEAKEFSADGNLTLSDNITLNLGTLIPPDYNKQYVDYSLFGNYKTYYIDHDSSVDFDTAVPGKSSVKSNIYNGRLFVMHGREPKIYLNDLLNNYSYNHEYMLSDKHKTYPVSMDWNDPVNKNYDFRADNVKNLMFDAETYLYSSSGETIGSVNIRDVLTIYPHIHDNTVLSFPNRVMISKKQEVENLSSYTSEITPVIPRLGTSSSGFYIGGIVVPSVGYVYNNYKSYVVEDDDKPGQPGRTEYESQMRISGIDKYGNITDDNIPAAYGKVKLAKFSAGINSIVVPDNVVDDLQQKNTCSIGITTKSGDIKTVWTKLADIDKCNAEYYVIWSNRAGCWQCQPFRCKNTLGENVQTVYASDYINKKSVISKSVDYMWRLNSDWLDIKQHDEFESLLISPVVQLYDTKHYRLYDVIVKTAKWEEKNRHNVKKPFNLSVELNLARQENILF